MRTTLRLAPWIAALCAVAACSAPPGGTPSEPPPGPPPPPAQDAGPPPSTDAPPPPVVPDGGTRPTTCNGVVPATSHPPFEAIKRLATTNQEVRILVYGQSISLQPWWTQVRDWLKATYPNGNLVMESHGRGSCSSECLVGEEAWFTDGVAENRLPGDVFAWNPDLVLFNVYGGEEDYTYIAKGFVQGCSAFDGHPVATAHCRPDQVFPNYKRPEVLLQTDHRLPGTYPVEDPNLKAHNEVFIPNLATSLDESWGDVWTRWGAYLDTHERDANAYLEDGLHLNDKGNALMAALVEQDLCFVP